MLKIWYGPEMEGSAKGLNTLFICSDESVDVNTFSSYLEDKSLNISRIYLGAGRVEFCGFLNSEQYIDFFKLCSENHIHVILETTQADINRFKDLLEFEDLEIVITVRAYSLPIDIDVYLKLDNYVTARIFDNKNFFDTDIVGVQDLYNCDVVLFDSERN